MQIRLLSFALIYIISQSAVASSDGSCLSALGLGVIPDGGIAIGYPSPTALPGVPCQTTIVTCIDGILNGSDLYSSCTDLPKDCQGLPNGASVTGYLTPITPCIPTTVTCTNGTLSGSMPFPTCN